MQTQLRENINKLTPLKQGFICFDYKDSKMIMLDLILAEQLAIEVPQLERIISVRDAQIETRDKIIITLEKKLLAEQNLRYLTENQLVSKDSIISVQGEILYAFKQKNKILKRDKKRIGVVGIALGALILTRELFFNNN